MDKQEYQARVAWLRRYRQAVRRQRLLAELLAERQAEAERISPLLRPLPGGPRQSAARADKLPRAVERVLAAEDDLAQQMRRCEAERAAVLAAICSLPDERQREVLTRRYILGQTFEQIAGCLHIDVRWAYRLHLKGVDCLDFDQ